MSLIYELFPKRLLDVFSCLDQYLNDIQEIRIRVNRPVTIRIHGVEKVVLKEGQVGEKIQAAFCLNEKDIEDIVRHLCHASPYAYEEEIKRGYMTVRGGHRVGLAGQAVLSADGAIKTLKNIAFINIRIAHEVKGAGERELSVIYNKNRIHNTLIVSPPGYGKTTLLRDIIRNISNGTTYAKGKNCVIIDERSELAGCYNGVPQLDVGIRTDVMDSCPKSIGMMMAIRSMAPQVMAVDELGTEEDIRALFAVVRSGCSILATVHGDSIENLCERNYLREVIHEKVFSRYIIIKNRQHDVEIWDGNWNRC